ncbi:TetR/AcrR family transcriptional regulator [Methylomonas sp. MED-D]|uniref:TetR family transcriptional regulator n=1 Tax=Methylomonas koyamae TaxID=702114 RepID=A0A177NH98_9GAMM|nr:MULTISPECIES: helix-turn-helix domain-containing protein [Methylomonas]MDT4331750.1 helix-turn-helix domain-containing protein [Methylomonas sp. MV1]OAI17232.1 TetR family transcriptional regulator [Methylomonas koyamae]
MEQEQEELEQTPQKHNVTQEEVLQAALKLFAKNGYFNTSLTDLKDALGLKTNTGINQHFKTKQAIAQALHEQIFDSLSISVDDIRRRNRKAAEQLREVVDLLFKLTDDAPEIVQFLLFVKSEEFLAEPKPLLETAAFNKIKRIFQNGVRDGEIRAIDPLLAYTYFFGIINQMLAMVLNGSLPKSAESYLAQAWITAWGAIVKK